MKAERKRRGREPRISAWADAEDSPAREDIFEDDGPSCGASEAQDKTAQMKAKQEELVAERAVLHKAVNDTQAEQVGRGASEKATQRKP